MKGPTQKNIKRGEKSRKKKKKTKKRRRRCPDVVANVKPTGDGEGSDGDCGGVDADGKHPVAVTDEKEHEHDDDDDEDVGDDDHDHDIDDDVDDATATKTGDAAAAAAALALCRHARQRWLSATTARDLDDVEQMYRQALNAKRKAPVDGTVVVGTTTKRRKRASSNNNVAALSPSDYRKAGERLSLLYLQSGRPERAQKGLEYLGFTCRLAERVLNYYPSPPPYENDGGGGGGRSRPKQQRRATATTPHQQQQPKHPPQRPPCVVLDDFLTTAELLHLQHAFLDPSASYWTDHNYSVEPPSPYFSYVMELSENKDGNDGDGYGFIGHLARKVWRCPRLRSQFPRLMQQQQQQQQRRRHQNNHIYVEVWAHNRPHASGHQLHFDSDDEGRGKTVRNPIMSTILYLSGNGADDGNDGGNDGGTNNNNHGRRSSLGGVVGGPSLITNQRLDSTRLATKGWLAHGMPRRMVAFDGQVLHGVVPGKGVVVIGGGGCGGGGGGDGGRRVTLMMAFWEDIQIRPGTNPGSARPWPKKRGKDGQDGSGHAAGTDAATTHLLPDWASHLMRTDVVGVAVDSCGGNNNNNNKAKRPSSPPSYSYREVDPIVLSHVYEHLDGRPWRGDDGPMPDYEQVFQGF